VGSSACTPAQPCAPAHLHVHRAVKGARTALSPPPAEGSPAQQQQPGGRPARRRPGSSPPGERTAAGRRGPLRAEGTGRDGRVCMTCRPEAACLRLDRACLACVCVAGEHPCLVHAISLHRICSGIWKAARHATLLNTSASMTNHPGKHVGRELLPHQTPATPQGLPVALWWVVQQRAAQRTEAAACLPRLPTSSNLIHVSRPGNVVTSTLPGFNAR